MRRLLRASLVFLFAIGSVEPLTAAPQSLPQPGACLGHAALQGMPIRTVTIQARGGWPPTVALPLGAGDPFDFAQLTEMQRLTSKAFNLDRLRDSIEIESQNALAVTFISSCVLLIEGPPCALTGLVPPPTRCLDVEIRPISVRLGLSDMAGNAFALARSNRPTAYSQTPALIRMFNPSFGIGHDRRVGLSETTRVSLELLNLPSTLAGGVPDDRNTHLTFKLQGSKSLNRRFYETDSAVTLERRRTGKLIEDLSVFAGFAANHQPLGVSRHYSNAIRAGSTVQLQPGTRVVDSVLLAGNYRRTHHRLVDSPVAGRAAVENSLDGRLLLGGRAGSGTWRASAWLETNQPRGTGGYGRFALLSGYQDELGKTEQTVGLEVMGGVGRAWGPVPDYAGFYGGTSLGNFLYEGADSPAMRSLPPGPLLRSSGRGQVAATPSVTQPGGYWHVNLNLTFPIPQWSCPLIPAIPLFENDAAQDGVAHPCKIKRPAGNIKTVKHALTGMVVTGQSFLSADIADELAAAGMQADTAEAEGQRRAEKVFRRIAPAMRFIVEKANLYAIKPLFMFDVAHIGVAGTKDLNLRVAAGGGLQMLIAIAKFEAGYLRAVRRQPGDPHGNFIARLVIQNLF